MSEHHETPVRAAERLLANVINGNRRDVRDELREMTGGRAAAVAGYMVDQCPDGERSSLLRLFEIAGDKA